jgi:branched-chain amino acid transport system ATP-binding protein
MSAALKLAGLTKSFGKTAVIMGVDLEIAKGERHAIIGPNGAGKSTLFNLITGRFPQSSGAVYLHGRNLLGLAPYQINRLGLSRSFQITNIFPRMSVFENVRCALLWSKGYKYSFWHMVGRARDLSEGAEAILEDINLSERRDAPAGMLSYAEQRALEIGITIAGGADVIMLDEPTAGMSHSETEYIVGLIRKVSENKTLVMVEHDMGVVFGLADRISVLVYGEIIATGTPEEVRANPKVQEAYLGTALEAEH